MSSASTTPLRECTRGLSEWLQVQYRSAGNCYARVPNADTQIGGAKQKGIIHHGISANRQNPFAGALYDAIFNTFRRSKNQVAYWLPVMLAGYYTLDWATERYDPSCVLRWHNMKLTFRRNHYLNSKAGRAEFGAEE